MSGYSFADLFSGDAVTLSFTGQSFGDKNVGVGKTVTFTGATISGNDAGNYQLASALPTVTANITPLALQVSNLRAANKVYDATNTATVDFSQAVYDNRQGNDVLSVSGVGTFNQATVGTNIPVSFTSLSLTGADAGNYSFAGGTLSTSGNITPRPITAVSGVTATDRVYDGTAVATVGLTGAILTGNLDGSNLTLTGRHSQLCRQGCWNEPHRDGDRCFPRRERRSQLHTRRPGDECGKHYTRHHQCGHGCERQQPCLRRWRHGDAQSQQRRFH